MRSNTMKEAGLCSTGKHSWVEGQKQCKFCQSEYRSNKRQNDVEFRVATDERVRKWKRNNPDRTREINRKSHEKNIKQIMIKNAKQRARRKGIPFNLKPEDILIPEVCPLLGIKLRHGTLTSNSPSLDRIVPELGYVVGNVWVISYKANTIKSNATVEEIEAVALGLRKRALR